MHYVGGMQKVHGTQRIIHNRENMHLIELIAPRRLEHCSKVMFDMLHDDEKVIVALWIARYNYIQ